MYRKIILAYVNYRYIATVNKLYFLFPSNKHYFCILTYHFLHLKIIFILFFCRVGSNAVLPPRGAAWDL